MSYKITKVDDVQTEQEHRVRALYLSLIRYLGDYSGDDAAGALITTLSYVVTVSGDNAVDVRMALASVTEALKASVEHNIFVMEKKPEGAILQ